MAQKKSSRRPSRKAKDTRSTRAAKPTTPREKSARRPPSITGRATSTEDSRHKLEAAILKDPDNMEAWLVYGDWLQEQGDPHGELLALQIADLQATPEQSRQLKLRILALLTQHEEAWLDDLAWATTQGELRVLQWDLGFIRGVFLGQKSTDSELDVPAALTRLFTLPAARFLRELRIGADCHGEVILYKEVIRAMRESKGCPTLESLFLGDVDLDTEFGRSEGGEDDEESEKIYEVRLGNIAPLYDLFPRLRSLRLRGENVELGRLRLPELREFVLESGYISQTHMQAITRAHWPRLERLELGLGTRGHEHQFIQLRHLQPLLEAQGLPHLQHLGLRELPSIQDFCAALVNSKLGPQLRSLDLSHCAMTDESATLLAVNAAALQNLRRLDVSRNRLTEHGRALLAGVCPEVISSHQMGDDDYYEDQWE